uniref:Uncharacterized protein n=1 Tax=Myripristis murdjan TaxID=586833 RepID=A0A667ZW15_9TELE
VVERWSCLLYCFDPSREEEERADSCVQKQNVKVSNNSYINTDHRCPPDNVPHEEEEGISTLQAREQEFGKLVLVSCCLTFQLVIQILQNDPDDLDQRQDQRAKGQGACVVSSPTQGGEDGVGRDIVWLLEGPVIRGKGPCQSDLAQCSHKVGAPEEEEDIVELEQDEVFVVEGLATVEGKQALCIRTLG